VQASSQSTRLSASLPGQTISATFQHQESGLIVEWTAELRDGSSYVKETYTIKATKPIDLKQIELIDIPAYYFQVTGEVPGSPLVSTTLGVFAGIELPVAQANVVDGTGVVSFKCHLPMKAESTHSFSTVRGVFPEDQLRRGFLYYLERERATPYHQYLHYNGWYDDGLNPTEESLIKTAKAYQKELGDRGVKLDGFVLDDGWDDVDEALWQPSTKKFPNGFSKVVEAVKEIPSSFGIWISPLGGYFGPEKRVEQAKKIGVLPEDATGFDLSYPGYYEWFRNRCSDLMQKDSVNYFKWDKAGDGVSPHFMALLSIANELRTINPKLFLNTTVGTWPSPFWLNHIDCTWRDGTGDVGWTGKGNDREQWMTFRDGSAYSTTVKRGPLYPLSSLMHHGMVLGKNFQAERVTRGEKGDAFNKDLKNDARMYFASGTNLQELYLTADLMDKAAWDQIAECAQWAKKWAPVLADVHWVGGDPNQLQAYGYAAWSRQGATLALRNPDDQPQEIELDLQEVFQPVGEGAKAIALSAAYKDQRVQQLILKQGEKVKLTLQPFEVLVFDTL
jgi:hypothetical protein